MGSIFCKSAKEEKVDKQMMHLLYMKFGLLLMLISYTHVAGSNPAESASLLGAKIAAGVYVLSFAAVLATIFKMRKTA